MSMQQDSNWKLQTIEMLERHNYGNADQAPTPMVKRCLELCRTPLINFTIEDLRLMIGQGFALPYLIPLAIEYLSDNLFAEGDYYPGDLLKNVLLIDTAFWKENPLLGKQFLSLLKAERNI